MQAASWLSGAEQELAKRTDGGAARGRHDFDLDTQDWAELAKEGTVVARHPCFRPNGWKPSPEQMQELGLAPDDVEPIEAAYKRSYERLWKTLRPLCAKAVGNADIADVTRPARTWWWTRCARRTARGRQRPCARWVRCAPGCGLRPPRGKSSTRCSTRSTR